MSSGAVDIKGGFRVLFDSGIVRDGGVLGAGRLLLLHFVDGGLALETNLLHDDGRLRVQLAYALNRREVVALRDALSDVLERGPLVDDE